MLCGLFISRLASILSLAVYYTKLKTGAGSSAHHVALLAPVALTPHASVGPTAEELGSGGTDPLRTPAAPASPVPPPQRPVQCHASTETPSGGSCTSAITSRSSLNKTDQSHRKGGPRRSAFSSSAIRLLRAAVTATAPSTPLSALGCAAAVDYASVVGV